MKIAWRYQNLPEVEVGVTSGCGHMNVNVVRMLM